MLVTPQFLSLRNSKYSNAYELASCSICVSPFIELLKSSLFKNVKPCMRLLENLSIVIFIVVDENLQEANDRLVSIWHFFYRVFIIWTYEFVRLLCERSNSLRFGTLSMLSIRYCRRSSSSSVSTRNRESKDSWRKPKFLPMNRYLTNRPSLL